MKRFFQRLFYVFSLKCKAASQLMSDSCERDLQFHERWALRIHLALCWSCKQFRRQIQFVRRAFQEISVVEPNQPHPQRLQLSESAKERMTQAMLKKLSPPDSTNS
ncbi:MAG: zf-HC2 domain-containing protein [Gemmataceae bacterium]